MLPRISSAMFHPRRGLGRVSAPVIHCPNPTGPVNLSVDPRWGNCIRASLSDQRASPQLNDQHLFLFAHVHNASSTLAGQVNPRSRVGSLSHGPRPTHAAELGDRRASIERCRNAHRIITACPSSTPSFVEHRAEKGWVGTSHTPLPTPL